MVSVQYFDQNGPRSVPSVQSSAVNDVYDTIAIDGIDLVAQYFEVEIDSDVESILTDSTYSDDSSYCSVDFGSDSDDHVDYCRQLPKMPLTTRQKQIRPLYDEFKGVNGNPNRNDIIDELASVISYDSLEDARKRGMIRRSIDSRLSHLRQSSNRPQKKTKSLTPKAERVFDLESDEETVYNIPLKWT